MAQALAGVRVLDCSTGIAGPKAAMLLADHGADVVKAEPPGGDPARDAAGFAVWNRGKRGIVADPHDPEGAARLAALLAGADVLVVSDPAERLAGTPLDPAAASAAHPRLVVLHAGPYTETAPWAGADESAELVCAHTGVSDRQYSHDDVPVDPVFPHVLYCQGVWGATCVLAALLERRRSGRGQVVLVGGLQGMLQMTPFTQQLDQPHQHLTGSTNPFYGHYECADGEWVFLACLTPAFRMNAAVALGCVDIFTDDRLEGEPGNVLLPRHRAWVVERLRQVFRTRPREEWMRVLDEGDCPNGPLLARDEWLDHDHVRALGMRVEVDDPERGRVVMPGVPLVATATPGAVAGPAPRLGEHDATVAPWPVATGEPDGTDDRADDRGDGDPGPAAGDGSALPLAGLTVLDLGTVVAGPYAGVLLADLGADVVKVEPLGGDAYRYAIGWAGMNLGTRSLAVDLRREDGRAAFLDVARRADVVIDNYRPGVLARLGVSHDHLAAVRSDVISVSITGFGEGGPLSDRAGFDPVLQAMSGMMRAQGGDDEPVFFTPPVNDVVSAAVAAFGACLALWHRDRTGQGQRVWTSLAQSSCLAQSGELVRVPGRAPAPVGGRNHPGPSATDRFHRTADGWVRVQAPGPEGRRRLVEAGLLAADVPEDEAATAAALAAGLATVTTAEAVARCTAAGVAAVASRALADLVHDPTVAGLDGVVRGQMGEWPHVHPGRRVRFSRSGGRGVPLAPGIGEHSRAVLGEHGVDGTRVDALVAAGAVAEGEPHDIGSYAG